MKRVIIIMLILLTLCTEFAFSQTWTWITCPDCRGLGGREATGGGRCRDCNGAGNIRGVRCTWCNGTGRARAAMSTCRTCGGSGTIIDISSFRYTREQLDTIMQNPEIMQRLRTNQSEREALMSYLTPELQRVLQERLASTDTPSTNSSGTATTGTTGTTNSTDFQMNGTVLVKYNGTAANVTIPTGVTAIGNEAFKNKSSLTSITIPSSVTSIGKHAFYGCSSLASITIPAGIAFIGYEAFSSTAWLDRQPDGLVYAGKMLYMYKGTMPANTVINNIRADTVAIVDYAFLKYTGLTSVTIPAGVTFIGNNVFSGCTGLTSITIPANIALGANVTDNGFNVVYNGNGKQAGTYISRFNRWFRGTATISVPASTDIAPGTVLEAALEGDVELFYRVTVPSNDLLLTITLSGSYPSITLYDGIGRCIAFDYYDSVYDNNAKISRNVSAGIYYIKVSVYSYYNDSTVPFTLHVLTETAR